MKLRRPALLAVTLAGVLALAALVLGAPGRAAEEDKGFLAGLISRALSTPASRVSVGAVEGALSSDALIRDIVISDAQGPWLKLDTLRLVWRRAALLRRRLEVDKLEIGRLDVLRRPIPATGAPGDAPPPADGEPLLPELPVKVEIQAFKLTELVLGEPVVGTAARLTASGKASLGAPAEGLDLTFDASRLDAGGSFAVRLSLVPQGEALTLKVTLAEPRGGILARAAGLPGLPPVNLDLDGRGTLDDFNAGLTFDAGAEIGARGDARLRRGDRGRRLDLDLGARVAGLLPPPAAPVFAGTTKLEGALTFPDAGGTRIERLAVVAAAAKLEVGGSVAPDGDLALKVSASAVPNAGGKTEAGGVAFGRLAFEGTVNGPAKAARIEASLDARDARLPYGELASLTARFRAAPNGPVTDPATRVALTADASATGIALDDPALARAVGDAASLSFRATAAPDGTTEVETLRFTAPAATGSFAGRVGPSTLAGRATLTAPDLARFGALAGLKLRGALEASAQLDGDPAKGLVVAALDARATRFATGLPAADGLLGGRLALQGTARKLAGGGYGFTALKAEGAHVTALVDGTVAPSAADLTAKLTLPELARADPRLTGAATATARVTGTLAHPDARIEAVVKDATALGRPVPRLALNATLTDLTGNLDARAKLDGTVDGRPARGSLHARRGPDGALTLDELDVALGSNRLSGGLALDAAGLATGRVSLKASDLAQLSALALTPLKGSAEAEVTLAAANGGQDAAIRATAARVEAGGVALRDLKLTAQGRDLLRRPVLDADLAADQLRVAGQEIERLRLTAKGTPQGSDIVASASALGFDLATRARLVPGEATRLEIASLEARRGKRRLALSRPATITLGDGGARIEGVSLAVEGGRVTVDGRVGDTLDLTAAANSVPLVAATIFAPNLDVSGTLDATARITGTPAEPRGQVNLRVARLAAPQTREAGLPPIDLRATGDLDGDRLRLDATAAAGSAGSLRATGSVPLGEGALDLAVTGKLDAGVANATLAPGGQRLTGRVAVDAKVGGTLASPQVNGSASLTGGAFSDASLGLRLTNLEARATARGDEIVIERATAATRNGGTIAASGRVRLDPAGGFPGAIRITGRRAELVSNGLVAASADLDLALDGPLARAPVVKGRIGIVAAEVRVPGRLPGSLRPIEGTRHVRPGPAAAKRLALAAKARARERRGGGFDARLDVSVDAPGTINVSGRGLDATIGGNLRVTGTSSSPIPNGAFELRRGQLDIVGRRLTFTRGRVAFAGDLTPDLDFIAEARAAEVTARVAVTGPANDPAFAFSSDPDLPQDEVLARLLFGQSVGSLSPLQAVQLASGVAQLSGGGDDGSGPGESLRRTLGAGALNLNFGGDDTKSRAGRALSGRLSIGVGSAGGSSAGTAGLGVGAGIDVDITKNVRARIEAGADGSAAGAVAAEYEW